MPPIRYRVLVKILCPDCIQAKKEGRLGLDCPKCDFLRYNNVTKLRNFTDFLDNKYPDWVWFKVYKYIKGEDGPFLKKFTNWHKNYIQNGSKWIYTGTSREVPSSNQL